MEVEAVHVLYLYTRMRAVFESSTSKPRATNAGSKVEAAENAFTTGRYSHDVWLGWAFGDYCAAFGEYCASAFGVVPVTGTSPCCWC